ncbi:bifunctional proline dehydrogenase/L-glutamate gamma-semialdehyde dehydrogenase PutA [Labrys okinawensis]|uniref:bifunctional proline dehydrogenase/L-glutamate gamma-semialdehyde dehydrogenase PutA n=1 Tax=Labrys okinawensis TaxID=346911 RepID=UPI0039BC8551
MPVMPQFHAPYAADDSTIVAQLLADPAIDQAGQARIDATATRLIEAIRKGVGSIGGIEDFLREYSLSTKEGLALMILAEALLRVPDKETADALIEDKLGQGDWANRETKSEARLVAASAWALGVTARVIQPGETPEGIVASLAKRIGLPAVRTATRQAMKVLGSHFVLGQTIGDALKRAASGEGRGFRYSFDMLGEGARTAEDARRYFKSYSDAIDAIGRSAGKQALPSRPGISVKLSALHPRYEALSRDRVMAELVPLVQELARKAKGYDLNFTVDAEEADRLELSLDVIAAVLADPALEGWIGFGLAIQAYQKRAYAVIEHIEALAKALGRRLMVRLVKGAYWDTEVKRAQERGLEDYPVFTRKAVTDLNYIHCARRMLEARPHIYPQFATHNALSIATIVELAGGTEGYEFQRLHGMGDLAYKALMKERPATACRVYAPVGGHADLLAYLVRRLLENGANSNFVSVAADPAVPISSLLRRPEIQIGNARKARHARIPMPSQLYGEERDNSDGVELGSREDLARLQADLAKGGKVDATPLINGKPVPGKARPVISPVDGKTVAGSVVEAGEDQAREAMKVAAAGFRAWDRTDVARRAAALDNAANLMEARRGPLLSLLQVEAGKTIDDAIAELREAVDFCRYYAAQARKLFAEGEAMPGPTGEENRLVHRGRGVFVCISPWNFPLAIFLGQVAAALAAGNAVVAKPAEQTPLIAHEAVKILLEAGVPGSVIQFVPGDGRIGAALINNAAVAGVAFTGSTETAWAINRALAAKNAPIVPLIAETGGINAMVVDATALPEQVADDVVLSAFRSAGQRCSALRLLCVQDDVADKIVTMIKGAAEELKLGDPRDLSVQIGPVIDAEAKTGLEAHIAEISKTSKTRLATKAPAEGTFVGPHIFEIGKVEDLKREVFGPVLHVVRWKAGKLDALLDAIAASGYGLTLGVHTRIDSTIEAVTDRMPAGNIYVNRNMIGAVVGTQPFGGVGLSGTGPKAGGPNYLKRFASEQVVAVNTAAAGGNASLIAMGEE